MMAHPINAYFGRDTHALLSRCAYCGKPYSEAERWHTLQTSIANTDAWCIACDKCYRETEQERKDDTE